MRLKVPRVVSSRHRIVGEPFVHRENFEPVEPYGVIARCPAKDGQFRIPLGDGCAGPVDQVTGTLIEETNRSDDGEPECIADIPFEVAAMPIRPDIRRKGMIRIRLEDGSSVSVDLNARENRSRHVLTLSFERTLIPRLPPCHHLGTGGSDGAHSCANCRRSPPMTGCRRNRRCTCVFQLAFHVGLDVSSAS